MNVAALTFVFNESINLPIWINYYGRNFGEKNLFVVDTESTDRSTEHLGAVNKITIPRDTFDDRKKADFMSSLQNALLNYYDAVVCGDCDEIMIPNMQKYSSLADYVSKRDFDYVTSIGLNLLHVIDREPPLDLGKPILGQRRYARFRSSACKTLLGRVPLKWLAGLHNTNRRPQFDPDLFIFHTKTMDYGIAVARQLINQQTPWSDDALLHNWGAHHRYDLTRFVREFFLDPINILSHGQVSPFVFDAEIEKFNSEVVEKDGFFWIPMNMSRIVEIPPDLRASF